MKVDVGSVGLFIQPCYIYTFENLVFRYHRHRKLFETEHCFPVPGEGSKGRKISANF